MLVNLPAGFELRRLAMRFSAQATSARATGEDRDRLLKMRDALLDLAKADDWLQGRSDRPDGGETSARMSERYKNSQELSDRPPCAIATKKLIDQTLA